jgi:hypothetical protein
MFQKMPEMLLLSIKNINVFWERTPRPSYFPHKSLTFWGNGTEGKNWDERSSPKEIRVGEPNILSCLKCKYILNIHDSQLHVLKQFL